MREYPICLWLDYNYDEKRSLTLPLPAGYHFNWAYDFSENVY